MRGTWTAIGLIALLWPTAASAEWRDQVAAMAVDVESVLPAICSIDEASLVQRIEGVYLAEGVAVVAADGAHLPGKEPHIHSVMMTGAYGADGLCFLAITSYLSRQQLALDAAGMMTFQEVGHHISSAYLLAPSSHLQQEIEAALAGSARELAKGISPQQGA